MRRVTFIADDFGVSAEVNEAIVLAHQRGALHGAALMMGQHATGHAVALARENPALEVGLHLHLVDSRPCTVARWPWRDSPARAGFAMALSPRHRALVRREIEAQWRAFRATGLPCHFVNAHHHLHVHPYVRRTLCRTLSDEFSGWIRWGRPRFFDGGRQAWTYAAMFLTLQAHACLTLPWRRSSTLWGLDRTHRMNAEEVRAAMERLPPGRHEFMFHPRRVRGDADTQCLLELAR